MKKLKNLIVGCGRSGTGFLAHSLSASGHPCGHEKIFTVYGVNDAVSAAFESSWYAVPHLTALSADIKILHMVRRPQDVIRSFYRIGLFAPTILQHASKGKPKKFARQLVTEPEAFFDRIGYVRAHRKYFKSHTTLLQDATEMGRLNAYWYSWNTRIEDYARTSGAPYMRVRLENVAEEADRIAAFLEVPHIQIEHEKKNEKPSYVRDMPEKITLSKDVETLSRAYGYA